MEVLDNLVLVCAGSDAAAAITHGLPLLYLCMGVGADGRLTRLRLPIRPEGHYLGVSDFGLTGTVSAFCAEALLDEVQKRKMRGLFADFERNNPAVHTFLHDLDERMDKIALPLFVPLAQAAHAPHARLVAEAALSGGNLDDYLGELASQYPGRLAASLRPISADYLLPSESSEGTPISAKNRQELQQKHDAQAFFSRDLCAKYFTYMDENDRGHFVLFDDATTLQAKLQHLHDLQIKPTFAMYPDAKRLLALDENAAKR